MSHVHWINVSKNRDCLKYYLLHKRCNLRDLAYCYEKHCKALSRLGFNADIYTDGELVGSTAQQEDLLEMELVQVGEDLKGGSDATQSVNELHAAKFSLLS